jgi:transposase-like protein
MDGLKGFSDAIRTVFPDVQIQRCIVHQIRNATKYVSFKDRKAFCGDLKKIYQAPTEEAGKCSLEEVKKAWPQYALGLKSWEQNWDELSLFYAYPEEVRRIIYTNNAIEGLHRQFRKITKSTSVFPTNDSLAKLLWLAQKDISRKWTMPIHNWGKIIGQFHLLFPDKITL